MFLHSFTRPVQLHCVLPVHNGHHDVVQRLLGAGAEVNIARSDVSDVTCVHRVHVHVYCGEDGGEAQHGVWVCLCARVCV